MLWKGKNFYQANSFSQRNGQYITDMNRLAAAHCTLAIDAQMPLFNQGGSAAAGADEPQIDQRTVEPQ